ncbi:MAG: hypothetical protein R2844_23865 [Caldilineales bacterium]
MLRDRGQPRLYLHPRRVFLRSATAGSGSGRGALRGISAGASSDRPKIWRSPCIAAGAYICGEETALLTSLEGYRGHPRLKPPFPAVEGLYRKPTIVNNVETITQVVPIVRNGADWYKQWGSEKSPGFALYCLSGQVKKPGVYELPYNTTLRS